ncbi:uncharacterized protein [Misgurnus anguillicaudatus]|uniref:uncharacterized protein n=1 Tax=Misgurnus anguillicaudatus TaxID=75329 RepID=UPI003CCF5D36
MFEPQEATNHAKTQSNRIPFLSQYSSKTDFLTYVLLYLVKMPFPPVTRRQGLPSSGKEKLSGPSSVNTVEEKSYVKDRLKKLSKKATPHKSKLPILTQRRLDWWGGKSAWITSPRLADLSCTSVASSPKCSSKDATKSTRKQQFPANVLVPNSSITTDNCRLQSFSRCSGSGRGKKDGEAVNLSINLTPEATLLLQKRSHGKQLRTIGGGTGKVTAHHRKDPSAKSGSQSNIPQVKISLLNDRHRYDDVEYEEEEEPGVDQSVLLKCSEWLEGVENAGGVSELGREDKMNQTTIYCYR